MIIQVSYTKYKFYYPALTWKRNHNGLEKQVLKIGNFEYNLLKSDPILFRKEFMKKEKGIYMRRFVVLDVIFITLILVLTIFVNFLPREFAINYTTYHQGEFILFPFMFLMFFFMAYTISGSLNSNMSLITVMIRQRIFVNSIIKLSEKSNSPEEFEEFYSQKYR